MKTIAGNKRHRTGKNPRAIRMGARKEVLRSAQRYASTRLRVPVVIEEGRRGVAWTTRVFRAGNCLRIQIRPDKLRSPVKWRKALRSCILFMAGRSLAKWRNHAAPH